MKQYFAKLLPIGTATIGQTTKSSFKLFLCSRDIQVGDVLQIIKDGKWYASPVISQEDIDAEISLPCYKVIGKISPQVTWIKDGDEFDKNEVYIPMPYLRSIPPIQIKGPCGHFH